MPGRRRPPEWQMGHGRIPPHVVAAMRSELPGMAAQTVAAVQAEVEEYADPFRGEMGRTIESAVALALGGFLSLVSGDEGDRAGSYERVWDAAYALGRGEVRAGRSMDALLRAYRIGARVSWRDMSAAGVRAGLDASSVAGFAELVFSYIDELSAASAAGHADELAVAGRVRQRLLERLGDALVAGDSPATVESLAERAGWPLPAAVSAVLVPEGRADRVRTRLPTGTLHSAAGPRGVPREGLPHFETLLVPGARMRAEVLRTAGPQAVVGPTVGWQQAASSAERAARVLRLREQRRLGDTETEGWGVLDADEHLAALAVTADEEVLADLRADVLAPLQGLRPATVAKLQETLRAWLLHQGRRDDVAGALFVHPQTVRYRVGQLREAYGDRLEDPQWVLRATIALGVDGTRPA